MIKSHKKTCAGFGSKTQGIALYSVCGELMPHAPCHAPMSPELPDRFNSGGFMGAVRRATQMAVACERIHEQRARLLCGAIRRLCLDVRLLAALAGPVGDDVGPAGAPVRAVPPGAGPRRVGEH